MTLADEQKNMSSTTVRTEALLERGASRVRKLGAGHASGPAVRTDSLQERRRFEPAVSSD